MTTTEPVVPAPDGTYPVAPKVKWSTAATYLGLLVLMAVLTGLRDGELLSFAPDWIATIFGPILPALITFVAGYAAPHQPRVGG